MRRILAPPARLRHAAAVRWCVYLLRCGDGTLYAGITNDLGKRLGAHQSGRGARYTRGRGPLTLVHQEPARTKSAALRREHELKRMRRREKLALLDSLRQRG
jgi:putative endonuclease